ncbi:MAG: PAS domain S-box protein [Thiohalocapsa sp.]|nr:PAS domain S-box protein [Thiohalocapsa sp.]
MLTNSALDSPSARNPQTARAVETFAFDWDLPNNRLRLDPYGAELLGVPSGADGWSGDGGRRLAAIIDEDLAGLRASVDGLWPRRPGYCTRYRMHTADGRERLLHEHGMGQFDADGVLIRLFGIIADVTPPDAAGGPAPASDPVSDPVSDPRSDPTSDPASDPDSDQPQAICPSPLSPPRNTGAASPGAPARTDAPAPAVLPGGQQKRLDLLVAIMDRIPVMVTVFDVGLKDLRVNREFERLLGWSNRDVAEFDIMQACYPDPVLRAEVQAFATEVEGEWRDFRMLAKDGMLIDVSWTNVGLSPTQRVGIGIDVRQRKRAERALLESQQGLQRHLQELEGIYANAPVGLCVLDESLRFRRVNARMADMNGLPADAHIGRSLREVAPDLAQQAEAVIERVLSKGEAVMDVEINAATAAHPDQPRTWLESWLPMTDGQGNITGINIVAREITEQRRTEARLAESEARFRDMAETVPDILFTADAGGATDYVNTRFYRITGADGGSAVGAGWLQALHPQDRERVASLWRDGAGGTEELRFRYRLHCAGGGYRWFETRVRPIHDARGNLVKWFGAASDVDELVRAREALEQADRQKNEFLAILGHELRNPMAPVRSAVDIMEEIAPDDPKLRWAIAVIDRQSRHLGRLVDDLLDVSRITRGQLSLDKRLCRLRALLEQSVDSVLPLIEERRHDFDVSLPDDPVYLSADPARFSQVLCNLLNNAAKYTPPGGTIRLAAEADERTVVIRVIDDGEGIDPALGAGLFDAFSQGQRHLDRSPGGLGLGLAVAARLTHMHDGRIEVRSEGQGKGAEFRVTLPRARPPRDGIEVSDAGAPDTPGRLRVLVVDDNADVADGMGTLLRLLGHDVEVRTSGAAALEAAEVFRPSVVLLDIGMQQMDGFETARRLRAAVPSTRALQLIAVSGYGDSGTIRKGREAGFDRHITKPVRRKTLEAVLGDAATALD